MTAPSPKDALADLQAWCDKQGSTRGAVDGYDYHSGEEAAYRHVAIEIKKRLEAIATLQPDGERREAIARQIDPDTYHAYDIHKKAGTVAENGKPWCDVVCGKDIAAALAKADAIIASGLVQNEAGWRDISMAPKDMTEIIALCGPKDVRLGWYFAPSSTTFGWRDQRQKPINPTHWMPLPAPPIRSARDGGAS